MALAASSRPPIRVRLHRRPVAVLLAAIGACLVASGWAAVAVGDPASDTAMSAALQRGRQLFESSWKAGGRSCAACHAAGRNRLTAQRVKSFPKFDAGWRRVLTVQQKLNQMIVDRCGGTAQALGSPDMNAIEAYVSTLP